MKKTITSYAIIICTCAVTLTSCSENKIDRMQNEVLKVTDMIIKDIQENNTSQDAMDALRKEAPKFREAASTLSGVMNEHINLTERQAEKAAEIKRKMTALMLSNNANPYLEAAGAQF